MKPTSNVPNSSSIIDSTKVVTNDPQRQSAPSPEKNGANYNTGASPFAGDALVRGAAKERKTNVEPTFRFYYASGQSNSVTIRPGETVAIRVDATAEMPDQRDLQRGNYELLSKPNRYPEEYLFRFGKPGTYRLDFAANTGTPSYVVTVEAASSGTSSPALQPPDASTVKPAVSFRYPHASYSTTIKRGQIVLIEAEGALPDRRGLQRGDYAMLSREYRATQCEYLFWFPKAGVHEITFLSGNAGGTNGTFKITVE